MLQTASASSGVCFPDWPTQGRSLCTSFFKETTGVRSRMEGEEGRVGVRVRGGDRYKARYLVSSRVCVCVCAYTRVYVCKHYAGYCSYAPRSALYANRLYLHLYRKYNPERLTGSGERQPRIVGEPKMYSLVSLWLM